MEQQPNRVSERALGTNQASLAHEKFSKLYIALKFRLHGAQMFKALVALEKGRELHDGWRKDKVTPEYQHQLEIALYLLTLKDVKNIEQVVIAALLHDALEDYPEKIEKSWIEKEFGSSMLLTLSRLNKNNYTHLKDYFDDLALDEIGSLVKLADRVNNIQSMNRGKFSLDKQKRYAKEVLDFFLPMAKKARKHFPQQMDSYYNLENMLKSQYELVMIFVNSHDAKNEETLPHKERQDRLEGGAKETQSMGLPGSHPSPRKP